MGTRPHYDWSPSDTLTELVNLDTPLHTSTLLSDSELKIIIESYPPMAHLEYGAPATIPIVERLMNKDQRYEDRSLKNSQYLLSAAFRPLDILNHELVSPESGNPNIERYCTILRDVCKLLLHVCSAMTQARNNIALQAVNPSFSLKQDKEIQYALPLDEFKNTLIQQTAARKATRKATVNRRQHRRFTPSNSVSFSSFSNVPDQQFFRLDPPSRQSGYIKNNNGDNFSNFNSNNNFRHNSNKKNTNPFRQ
ncbi:hypothetical protein G6F55_004325 [Rhizopus delemar]|nr:hypothetical protein G6F55_004325 [Rhizopus delemar]KAG1585029.1 hypothetical protein G6F48_007523 [Rhizopus delemar]